MLKFIEKIKWDKEIAQIPFFKNKQLHINIEYQGYTWECGFEWQKDTSFMSRGWWLKFTLFGILFKIYFSDKRWYNEKEGRFYLDDEPRWTEFWDPSYSNLYAKTPGNKRRILWKGRGRNEKKPMGN